MTLTEFLLDRIAEDAEGARAASGPRWHSRYEDQPDCHMYGEFGFYVKGPAGAPELEDSEQGKHDADFIAHHDPARVLAECEAKRRIVKGSDLYGGTGSDEFLYHEVVLAILAAVYADHPDYDEAWRP